MNIIFVCCPKPFYPEFANIQKQAVASWSNLPCKKKIIVCGNEYKIAEFAHENNHVHMPNIGYTENGSPIVSDIFQIGQRECPASGLWCYINSDIILSDDFVETCKAYLAAFDKDQKQFVLVGERWDWNGKSTPVRHGPTGMDYFVCSKDAFTFVHPFALGKFHWDMWLLGNAFRRNIRTVDVTETVYALHLDANWYCNGNVCGNVDVVLSSVDAMQNTSFEKFGLSITDGTKWMSTKINGKILFKMKK